MMPIRARSIAGAALLASGLAMLAQDPPSSWPSATSVVPHAGPLRGLPVPFAWARFGAAEEEQNRRALRSPAWLLAWLIPEQPEMIYELAWRRAYDDAAFARDLRGQAEALVDALEILDFAASIRGQRGAALAWQGFHLHARCASLEGADARRAAFRDLTGLDPLVLAIQKLEEAQAYDARVDWPRWMQASTEEFRGAAAIEGEDWPLARDALRRAAEIWTSRKPARSALLGRLAAAVEALAQQRPLHSATLSREDCELLTQDLIFGRKTARFVRRFEKR